MRFGCVGHVFCNGYEKTHNLENATIKKSSAYSELSRKGWLALLLLMREKGSNATESAGRLFNTISADSNRTGMSAVHKYLTGSFSVSQSANPLHRW